MYNLDKYDNIGLVNKINKIIKTKSNSFLSKNSEFIYKNINSDDRQKLIDLLNFVYSNEEKRVIKQTKINMSLIDRIKHMKFATDATHKPIVRYNENHAVWTGAERLQTCLVVVST
jgi:hypothetical protein